MKIKTQKNKKLCLMLEFQNISLLLTKNYNLKFYRTICQDENIPDEMKIGYMNRI